MDLQKYIAWLDSSIRFGVPLRKDSLQEIKEAMITIQETYCVRDESFAKQKNLFT